MKKLSPRRLSNITTVDPSKRILFSRLEDSDEEEKSTCKCTAYDTAQHKLETPQHPAN